MRLVRIFLIALAAILVAGAVASAAPPIRGVSEDEPSPGVSATPSPEPTDATEPVESPEPEPTETPSPEPVAVETETETSGEDEAVADDATAPPDFSACVGLHGLENAICRHEALLAVQPDNVGLQNALAQLEANLAKHEEEQVGGAEDGGKPSCPGKSCEPHGNGNGNGNGG